ncbi:MAG: CBS domain-containing protein [Chloroflexi bacterium]|nr:CBS domain-containing protein [Chloroflexota bacterium]
MEVILSHENADFDAIASLLAASRLFPEALPVLPRRLNRNVADFLTLYGDQFPFRQADDLSRQKVERAILVDTTNILQVRGMRDDTPWLVIDHHLKDKETRPNTEYHVAEMGATTTILTEDLCQRDISLTPIEATLLILGIYEDTGSLSYATTRQQDLHCAGWLLAQGAKLEVVNRFLHHPLLPEQQKLYHTLAQNAEHLKFQGHTIVIATARPPAYVEELSTLAHKLRDLFEPDAIFLLVQFDDHVQLVARSTTDDVDVGAVAKALDGGGHARAAAAMLDNTNLDQAKSRLISLLDNRIHPSIRVSQIMSVGQVRTLRSQNTVAEAQEAMQRYGHEGFPVIDQGRLVGLITRRDVDKAAFHQLAKRPIENYMIKGEIAVSPDDSVEHLQSLMMSLGLGQVPVVENGEVVGIVTRTDLIKLWTTPTILPARAMHLAAKMDKALPVELRQKLALVSQIATEMNYAIYVVGGFVRDLLLDIPRSPDLDIVVDGDAIALARRLAERAGGRVHSHSRFGTANWIFAEEIETEGPPNSHIGHLDLITARTEFYEAPTVLPTVERGSIKSDLHRRDFTINTMAICLDRRRYGMLLDFYGGLRDLEAGLIRVLHNLSFVEDPTRILRAARLEQRLSFKIEPRTAELISDALTMLDRVSGERIRHELYLIFEEAAPERALARLEQLQVLGHIQHDLTLTPRLEHAIIQLRERLPSWYGQTGQSSVGRPYPWQYLALLLFPISPGARLEILHRLRVPNGESGQIQLAAKLHARRRALAAETMPASAIAHALRAANADVLGLLWAIWDQGAARDRLLTYQTRWRHIDPHLNGHDLQAIGLKPGPIFRRILTSLQDACLDGLVHTREEEVAYVQHLLSIELPEGQDKTLHGAHKEGRESKK